MTDVAAHFLPYRWNALANDITKATNFGGISARWRGAGFRFLRRDQLGTRQRQRPWQCKWHSWHNRRSP